MIPTFHEFSLEQKSQNAGAPYMVFLLRLKKDKSQFRRSFFFMAQIPAIFDLSLHLIPNHSYILLGI